jgi:hypothetical protein
VSIPSAWTQVLDFFGIPLVIEPSPGRLSGDAGLLPIRQFDQPERDSTRPRKKEFTGRIPFS